MKSNTDYPLYQQADELRSRHAVFLTSLGKKTQEQQPAIAIAARTLVCDAANGETVMPDYKALKKLLKTNLKKLKYERNKLLAYAMRNGKVPLTEKDRNAQFPDKTDLEILDVLDKDSAQLMQDYTALIKAVKSAK